MNAAISKLGIISGSGDLPAQVIDACKKVGRECFVIAFKGITDEKTTKDVPHQTVHIGRIGSAIKALKDENIKELLLAGSVGRPSMSSLNFDFSGLRLLKRLSKLPSQGDDVVFTEIISFLEDKGFNVVGAESVLSDLFIGKEVLGDVEPNDTALNDIEIGRDAALEIGKLDIGQAVIIQQGQILGVEGAEGTDRLVARCKELHNEGQGGVLVKMKKPKQDSRVDLPSIGVHTIDNAKESGLCGIAIESGSSLVINRDKVVEKANELGIFVVGI